MTRLTLPTCRAHYPDGPDGCARRLLPRLHGLPRFCDGSASATSLSRPAQALLTLRPVGSLDRPRRPLSRGFGPAGCPSGPLVSYQLNRQLAGWNLPPLVNRALRAHGLVGVKPADALVVAVLRPLDQQRSAPSLFAACLRT